MFSRFGLFLAARAGTLLFDRGWFRCLGRVFSFDGLYNALQGANDLPCGLCGCCRSWLGGGLIVGCRCLVGRRAAHAGPNTVLDLIAAEAVGLAGRGNDCVGIISLLRGLV